MNNGSSTKEETPKDDSTSTEEKPSNSDNEKASDSSAEQKKNDGRWLDSLKNAGKKVGKALGFGGEEPAAAPAAEPVKAAPAAKPAAPAAKTITSGGPKTQAELQNPSKVKTSDAPVGGKAPVGKTSSNSSGSSSGGSKPFFNDKSLKYGLTGAGIGGAVRYIARDDDRRSRTTEDEDLDFEDDEILEEALKKYRKENAHLFIS